MNSFMSSMQDLFSDVEREAWGNFGHHRDLFRNLGFPLCSIIKLDLLSGNSQKKLCQTDTFNLTKLACCSLELASYTELVRGNEL